MTWKQMSTAERIEAIKAAWHPETSASKLAAAAGAPSRNAIIGMYGRWRGKLAGFPLQSPATVKGEAKRMVKSTPRPRLVKVRPTPPRFVSVPIAPTIFVDPFDSPQPLNLILTELTAHTCKWPVNEPEPGTNGHLFCGHETELGSSYCHHHAMKSVGRGTESERSALRSLARAA